MVLRKIFGSKKVEVTGDWRKLHNYTLMNEMKQDVMGGECNTFKEKRNFYTVLAWKPEEKEHWVDVGVD
jgi:hypothetical protein